MKNRVQAGEDLQNSSETSFVLWFGGFSTDKMSGGRAGDGRAEEAQIFVGSDEE